MEDLLSTTRLESDVSLLVGRTGGGQLGIELLPLMVKYDYRPVTCILRHNARHWTGMTRTTPTYNAQTH